MADPLDLSALAAHVGPGCAHAKAARIEAVHAKWLLTPEAVAAHALLAKMMDCACADLKSVADLKEPAAKEIRFTTADAVAVAEARGKVEAR